MVGFASSFFFFSRRGIFNMCSWRPNARRARGGGIPTDWQQLVSEKLSPVCRETSRITIYLVL